jgi:hypothetical protein
MRGTRSTWMRGTLALAILSALTLSALMTPAVAHIGDTVDHLWNDHIKQLTDNRYFTKAEANIRFARAPMWAHVNEAGVLVASAGVQGVTKVGGRYYVEFTSSPLNQPIVATVSSLGNDISGELSVAPCASLPVAPEPGDDCPEEVDTLNTVRVIITGGFGVMDSAFYIRVR